MKVVQLGHEDLSEALRSPDPVRRNAAFRSLYGSTKIKATLRDWAGLYNLRSMTTDDVLQEAIILLDSLIRAGRFRAESRVDTFLLGICKNIIRDSVKKVQRVVFKETLTDADLADVEKVADSLLLEEASQATETRDSELEKAVKSLGDGCEEALKLYYFENQNMAQVAENAQKSTLSNADQAKKKVFRCRERLREAIIQNPILQKLLNPPS